MTNLSKANYLSEIRHIDWDFDESTNKNGISSLHWYPARFVREIPSILIGYFSEIGDKVLDPYCGSGTTLTEAVRLGRIAFGIDINPIATLMSQAKIQYIDEEVLENLIINFTTKYNYIISNNLAEQEKLENENEIKCWYHFHTFLELKNIYFTILSLVAENKEVESILLTGFSSILKTTCSQRKHYGWICDNVKPKEYIYRDAKSIFLKNLKRMVKHKTSFYNRMKSGNIDTNILSNSKVYNGDSIEEIEKFEENYFDLIVTSPPYLNMTDYVKAQRLSLLWFNLKLDEFKKKEVGARYKRSNRKKSKTNYVNYLRKSISCYSRVLKSKGKLCFIVGESNKHLPYIEELTELLKVGNYRKVDILKRKIPLNRSLTPSIFTESILIYENDK